ncbi:MAG: Rho termination factor N-terminal domain-containing protein [Prochlorothrix sp.]
MATPALISSPHRTDPASPVTSSPAATPSATPVNPPAFPSEPDLQAEPDPKIIVGTTPAQPPAEPPPLDLGASTPASLPLQLSIDTSHLLTLLSTLETPALSQVIQWLSTVLEQRQAQHAAVQLRETLEQKTVPELKALAQELGLSLRSRLKKREIIAAIVTAQTQPTTMPAPNSDLHSDLPESPASTNVEAEVTSGRDNRAAWEQWCREVDALEYAPPNPEKGVGDAFLEKFRRQGLQV